MLPAKFCMQGRGNTQWYCWMNINRPLTSLQGSEIVAHAPSLLQLNKDIMRIFSSTSFVPCCIVDKSCVAQSCFSICLCLCALSSALDLRFWFHDDCKNKTTAMLLLCCVKCRYSLLHLVWLNFSQNDSVPKMLTKKSPTSVLSRIYLSKSNIVPCCIVDKSYVAQSCFSICLLSAAHLT